MGATQKNFAKGEDAIDYNKIIRCLKKFRFV